MITLLICSYILLPLSYASPAIGGHFSRQLMPIIELLDVKCGRTGMSTHITFSRPFSGVIYSKGHYYDSNCNYVNAEASNNKMFSFFIPAEGCGSYSDLRDPTKDREKFVENIIIIQNDPLIQEIWDESRRIRCTWKNQMKKSVKAPPITVQEPKKVELHFNSKSINTLDLIQKGSGPFSAPVAGYIFQKDQTSLVIYVQDNNKKLDANIVSCFVRQNGRKIELVDAYGCVVNTNLITPFIKTKQPNGIEADIMFYSYLKDMKLDKSDDFDIGCYLEVCEKSCIEACSLKPSPRVRRHLELHPHTNLALITK